MTARADLRAALAAHVPADAAEAWDVQRARWLVDERERFWDRAERVPGHVTGSAFIVRADTGAVLLHEHLKIGRWLQPGGHDDTGEGPQAAALREAAEETGLPGLRLLADAILDVDVHTAGRRDELPHLHFDVRYALLAPEPDALAPAAGESQALAWLPPDEAARRMGEAAGARAIARLVGLL